MTQRFFPVSDLSVRENLESSRGSTACATPRAPRATYRAAGVIGPRGTTRRELSGGWNSGCALGACTLPNPQLLLLDEPTAASNPKARRRFLDTRSIALADEG